MKHGSLFSGIGGFDLAAHWMGWENAFHCEWMEFPRKVLDYYFPEADSHVDICKTDFRKYEGKVDIITGGFPCQPFSMAGKRKGTEDERYLWDEMLRTICEVKPKYVIAENVFGLTNIEGGLVFEKVWSDLENQGYEVQPFVIPSASKNAPHRRDRIWIIAYRSGLRFDTRRSEQSLSGNRTNGNEGIATDTTNFRRKNALANRKLERRRSRVGNKPPTWNAFPSESPICGGNDGLPTELDGITFSKWRNQSIKGYGNAIVPQVALEIFKVIQEIDNQLL
jgi:DNA (cytosine-5)-methyltransferase 1